MSFIKEFEKQWKVTNDRLMVRPFSAETVSTGGIIIPDSAVEKLSSGTVVSVGLKVVEIRVGDIVNYGKYSGTKIPGTSDPKSEDEKEELVVMREDEIIAFNPAIETTKDKGDDKNSTSFKPGKEHKNWKGGSYITDKGYRMIMVEGSYIPEHIHLMELKIGRKLHKNEVVHHKDEDRLNNDIDNNLELMTRSQHQRHHATGKIASEETKAKFRELRKDTNQKESHQQWRSEVTKEKIEVLLKTNMNKKQIALELGIHPDTLRARLKHYGLFHKE